VALVSNRDNMTSLAEERIILCSNALDESRGKELQLCCDNVLVDYLKISVFCHDVSTFSGDLKELIEE